MPNGKDYELSADLAKLRDETIRTQGEAAWAAVARYLDLPDDAVTDKRRRGGRMADARGEIVGVKPKKPPAFSRSAGNRGVRGVSWREQKEGQRGAPHLDARLRIVVVTGKRGFSCALCDRRLLPGDEMAVVSTAATQRRCCPACGTTEYRRLREGGPNEGDE